MPMDLVPDKGFSRRLKTWRRMHGIKQTALAEMLGVSQTTVSYWENGQDLPSASNFKRLRQIIAHATSDEIGIERLFVERQSGLRALIEYDGARLIAASRGFRALWPRTSEFQGTFMADFLVNEGHRIVLDKDMNKAVSSGSLGLASGISERMLSLEIDEVIPYRWHMCFRRYGLRTIIDMVFETTEVDAPVGITDLVYLDDQALA